MRLIGGLLLGLMAISLGPCLADTPDVYGVLLRVAEKEEDIPHRGVSMTTFVGPDGREFTMARRVYHGNRGRYRVHMDAPPPINRYVTLSDGDRLWRVLGDEDDVAFVSAKQSFEDRRRKRMERARELKDRGRASIRAGRMMDRPTWHVTIERKGRRGEDWHRARSLDIDQKTYLELANTTYGRFGETVSRTMYESIVYLDEDDIDTRRFEYEPKEHTLILPDPTKMGHPSRYRDTAERAPWLVPLRGRPEGWRPEGISVHYFGRQPVVQFLYTADQGDGERPRPVVLLEKPVGEKAPHFDEFFDLSDLRSQPVVRDQAVVWADEKLVYVLAASLPARELLAAAHAHIRAGDDAATCDWPGAPGSWESSSPGPTSISASH